jgi:hypothetical protein
MEVWMRGNHFAELSAFTGVAEHSSYTKAARALGLSTATLSQTVRALEDRLGETDDQATKSGVEEVAVADHGWAN